MADFTEKKVIRGGVLNRGVCYRTGRKWEAFHDIDDVWRDNRMKFGYVPSDIEQNKICNFFCKIIFGGLKM